MATTPVCEDPCSYGGVEEIFRNTEDQDAHQGAFFGDAIVCIRILFLNVCFTQVVDGLQDCI